MQSCTKWFFILALLICGIASGAPAPREQDLLQGPVLLTGLEDTPYAGMTFPDRPIPTTLDDPIVPVHLVGMTWYDNQHNGSAGKQLAVDREGWVHHVWTRGINSGSTQRHVFYNVWDPFGDEFTLPDPSDPIGVAVDAASRAGYVTVEVNDDGYAFPAFHQGTNAHMTAAVGMDFFPRLGGFQTWAPPTLPGNPELDWPKIAVDVEGNIHLVVTESLDDDNADGREFYAKGLVWLNGVDDSLTWPRGWEAWRQSWFITMDVDASPVSDMIAVAWLENPNVWGVNPDNDNVYTDVWLRISTDLGETWQEPFNVTNFANVDTNCVNLGGDPNVCNADTMRPWLDVNVLIDQNDIIHLAFTCSGWFWWDYDGTPLANHGYVWSNMWHWDSERQEFNIIHEAWYSHGSVALGSNNTMAHRPNLAVDTTNGYLYCSFQKFDSVQVSANGFPSGDAWLTVSTDSGRTWSEAVNVSNTDGGINTPPDSCKSERDISLAKYVTGGMVHMQYMMDRDNGTSISEDPEGVPTNNPMYYLQIPTNLIPVEPHINPLRNLRADSTGFPWDLLDVTDVPSGAIPDRFTLYQNYPNPFNPATSIQFDLPTETLVSLRVFDVLGREVKTLINNQRLSAGVHISNFAAEDFASGIYFYRLETPQISETRKMVLMK